MTAAGDKARSLAPPFPLQDNFSRYDGDASFLAGPTENTKALWAAVEKLQAAELAAGGLLDVDPVTPSTMTAFPAGYIDKSKEVVVGLQTDKPLKRAIKPLGGYKMVEAALKAYGRELDPATRDIFFK